MYDIAIVGAGPAGATLARLLGKQYRVLLLDRRRHDLSGPGKCCGGLLAPDAQKVLAEMGLGLPGDILVGPQLFVVRVIDLDHSQEQYYQRFYINIDRQRFDRWLVSLIPDQVDARFGVVFKRYLRGKDAFTISFEQDDQERVEQAKLLVGADGAGSRVHRLADPDAALPANYVCIQEWFEVERPMPYFTAVFDSSITDFYGWTIPKHDQLLVGVALEPGEAAEARFQAFKQRLQQYGITWGERSRREGALMVRPRTADVSPVINGVALIGEAAGWISPSSAEGLSYAFNSALNLAGSLQPGLDGALLRYRQSSRKLRLKIFGKNLKSVGMYQPQLRSLAMRSGLFSLTMRGRPGQ